jgi:vancomycin resistance protein YoaR
MKRTIVFLSSALGAVCVLALVPIQSTRAAAGDFSVGNQQYEFFIDRATLNSWKGSFTIPYETKVLRPFFGLDLLVQASLLPGMSVPAASDGRSDTFNYDPAAVYSWVSKVAPTLSAQPQEPKLVIENGRATEFQPPTPGQTLDAYRTSFNILDALEAREDSASLLTEDVLPKQSLAALNNLGINELIGHGVSNYARSPHNRIVNIHVGVSKFAGVIIPQGQTFSFNKNLGPVEAYEGFLPELVIKAEGTIPELGGGLCQVSTTTFRAAMDAGLPIVERRMHAYAVQYYAPQGTDATIYPGVVDLKFTNDTPGAILIWPHFIDPSTLIFDFYGTKDDRQISIDKPIQFDRKADGSMKATWTRTVVKNGQVRRDVFQSVYQPPALYHKQEQFVSAPPGTTGETPTPNPLPPPATNPGATIIPPIVPPTPPTSTN